MLLITVWGYGFARFIVTIETMKPENTDQKTDAIIILTGGNYRIFTGLTLFADGLAPKMMISGVHKTVTASDILSTWKSEKPLPDCCLYLGHDAQTTIENAIEVQKWIKEYKIQSIRLVTSAYHMPRAKIEFKNLMPEANIIYHPVQEQDYTQDDPRFWSIALSEYNKILLRYLSFLISDH